MTTSLGEIQTLGDLEAHLASLPVDEDTWWTSLFLQCAEGWREDTGYEDDDPIDSSLLGSLEGRFQFHLERAEAPCEEGEEPCPDLAEGSRACLAFLQSLREEKGL